jgi:hypothetical protein
MRRHFGRFRYGKLLRVTAKIRRAKNKIHRDGSAGGIGFEAATDNAVRRLAGGQA